MAKHNKPVAGSRGFWPRKRATHLYERMKSHKEVKDAMALDFAGYKAGMTQISYEDTVKGAATFGKEVIKAATVLEIPPLFVHGIRVYKDTTKGLKDVGFVMAEKPTKQAKRRISVSKKAQIKEQLAALEKLMTEAKEVRLVMCTQPDQSGVGKKTPELFEVSLGGSVQEQWAFAKERLGSELRCDEVFKEGEHIDVRAVTKGKGTQGPVKRFGITIRSRKNKGKRRHVGNIGSVGRARVIPAKLAMPGQHGFQNRTEYNKRIVKIASGEFNPKGDWINYGKITKNYMILEGSIPGPRKRLVMMRKGIRSADQEKPIEIKHISLDSQQ